MITIRQKGSFSKTIRFLGIMYRFDFKSLLRREAERGVEALRNATPVDTGKTANSWYYEISTSYNHIRINWCNSNITGNVPVALLIQYGHATKNGFYLEGRDFINPAIQPVFDSIADVIWNEVVKS